MPILNRVLAYFGLLAAGACAIAVSTFVLLSAGAVALPQLEKASEPPRITAWLERREAAMPELPKPHGPALTAAELRTYARAASAKPITRIPIMAMTEAEREPPTVHVSSARRTPSRPRPSSPRPANETYRTAEVEAPAYAPTARERYAPERNY